jgi:hypothetical protein
MRRWVSNKPVHQMQKAGAFINGCTLTKPIVFSNFSGSFLHCSPAAFGDLKMILRTDTIGHFEKPTETNIREAISYPGENATENDIVKLMIDDENFLCVWIGKKDVGHLVELISGSNKVACKERFSSENAIQIMIKYLHEDISWVDNFSWEKTLSQKLLENIQIFIKSKS